MTLYVSSLGSRLGDLVVMLPIIDGLISRGDRVILVVRSPLQMEFAGFLTGLAGVIKEHELENATGREPGRLCNFFEDVNQRNYGKRGSIPISEYEKTTIGQRLNLACHEFGLALDDYELLGLHSLSFDYLPEYRNKVIFIPGATGSSKRWPVEHWLGLADMLASSSLSPIVVGQPELCPDVAAIADGGVQFVATPRLREAINIISSCKLVISSDTGLMHLSVHQKKATVCIFNQLTSIWFRKYPHSYILAGDRCRPECLQTADDVDLQFQRSLDLHGPVAYERSIWQGEDYVPCVQLMNRCTAAVYPAHVLRLLQEASLMGSPVPASASGFSSN